MKPELRRRRIGSLDCLELIQDVNGPYIIIFHGYGADNADLAPLAKSLQVSKTCNWIFPNGPSKVEIGPHMEGRAWFPIRVADLEAGGKDLFSQTPPGMKKSREAALEMIASLNVPWNRIILGGFSQGAMMATELSLQAPQSPAGLVIMSGTLLDQERWTKLAANHKGLAFYQSHGAYDSILPMLGAIKLEKLLQDAGLKGKLRQFAGEHGIPPEILMEIGHFLRSVLSR